jgi:hypothetical protein
MWALFQHMTILCWLFKNTEQFRVAKTTHAPKEIPVVDSPLAFACRLVAVLCEVVQSGCRFDEHVLYVGKFRDFGFCRRIAAQPISDDLARHRARAQHTFEEAFSGGLAAPLFAAEFLPRAIVRDRTAHLTMLFGHERLLAFDRRCLRDTSASPCRRGM